MVSQRGPLKARNEAAVASASPAAAYQPPHRRRVPEAGGTAQAAATTAACSKADASASIKGRRSVLADLEGPWPPLPHNEAALDLPATPTGAAAAAPASAEPSQQQQDPHTPAVEHPQPESSEEETPSASKDFAMLARLPPPSTSAALPASIRATSDGPAKLSASYLRSSCSASATATAVDVCELLITIDALLAAPREGSAALPPAARAALGSCLGALDAAVLASLPDDQLAGLLHRLQSPALAGRVSGAPGVGGRQGAWSVPEVEALLPALQAVCAERLRPSHEPCSTSAFCLAIFCFCIRAAERGAWLSDGLLVAVASFLSRHMHDLSLRALSAGLLLLARAGWRPGGSAHSAVTLGNAAVERLLALRELKGNTGLDLAALAWGMEALAELGCVDSLAGISLAQLVTEHVTLAAAGVGQQLSQSALQHLARAVCALAVISATAGLTSSSTVKLLAVWRVLVLQLEGSPLTPSMAHTLAHMWSASCLLSAAVHDGDSFHLPGALGLRAAAAWSQEEGRGGAGAGVSLAQRRVLSALGLVGLPASNAAHLNVVIGELISLPVLLAMPHRRVAVLILEPHEVLRNSSAGEPRGPAVARERMLQAAGLHVVRLDRVSATVLPLNVLAQQICELMEVPGGRCSALDIILS
eukprot:scaffold1.g5502.t1